MIILLVNLVNIWYNDLGWYGKGSVDNAGKFFGNY